MQKRLPLIIGIVLAIISALMIKVYLDQQRRHIQEEAKKTLAQIQTSQVAVLVARQDIPRGAVIEPGMLESAIIPNKYVQPQAVTSLDRVAGMMTVASISKGEQITLSKLAYSKRIGANLAEATPVGKRAITISVDNIASSLAGMIKPGDYVDVIALLPVSVQTAEGKKAAQVEAMPLFQNVLVLATGQETSVIPQQEGRYKKEERQEIALLITLALSPQEASLIAFVQEQGKIRLVLRSPADSQIESVQPVTWETLFRYLRPKEVAKSEIKEEPKVTPEYIEIYRGLNKEKIPITK